MACNDGVIVAAGRSYFGDSSCNDYQRGVFCGSCNDMQMMQKVGGCMGDFSFSVMDIVVVAGLVAVLSLDEVTGSMLKVKKVKIVRLF